ncbi:hypothetical protein [Ferrimicrobium acidiphilum]|jgi:hypothetical protein|uniref:HPP family protein n=1 Tax=Ferrimicrobium acidiphilum DSM 19497 TaxID=1121877 RepID=A0A0D8FQI5_9ACTN|nr:hypothetical protein [Ferrimicrobium acidiphilum]KJE75538.1 hypothetical protein FEAC_27320 [Ferrimicrobium acidiphilum DSM 19497]MCL5052808.1 hypothetical protein [Gammaproteobacteria bacterium]
MIEWQRSHWFRGLLVLVAVALMIAIATIFNQAVMLVPEVGAVSTGLLFFRISAWRKGPLPFYLLICGAAFLGVEVARYLPIGLTAQIIVTLSSILAAVLFFRVPAYPALSAGLLPVYLHLTSPLYVVAVVCFMGLPTLYVLVVERSGLGPGPKVVVTLRTTVIIACSLGLMILALWLARSPLAVLPPLFVASVENANTSEPRSIRRLSLTALVLLASIELSILLYLNLNVDLVVVITVLIALLVVSKLNLESPPILALAIIPIVFDHPTDLRVSYLIVIGIVLSQIAPVTVAWVIDHSPLLARIMRRPEGLRSTTTSNSRLRPCSDPRVDGTLL